VLILLPPSEKKATTPVAAPAIKVYIGVLYEALSWATLSKAAQKKGEGALVIISAKYGAIGPLEKIKSYKAKIENSKMKAQVAEFLDPRREELIIDCRSSTYQGVWGAPNKNCIEIRVFQNINGAKRVITHMSKKTRGEVVRLLLVNKSTPKTPRDVRDIVNLHYSCALIQWDSFNPWILEVIAHEKDEG
jgi:cytoplasmic iron level regulating protein YaaA (DUF328/UPF0246 family)